MLFNSFEFLIFLPIVFLLYWFVFNKMLPWQNALILIASYFFYGWWSWKFMGLLMLSTLLDYTYGFWVASPNRKKAKVFLWLSIINNLGILCIFKYYNFFAKQFQEGLELIGFHTNPVILNVALPIGISFYTFHGMSYVFDIYRGQQKPVKSIIDYAVFVGFFPLLVAGPIERANHLLPQVQKFRSFNYVQAVEGFRLILWGLFKKVVVADSLSTVVDEIFNNYQEYNSISLIVGAIAFSFQIYGDFSGYSDIALGTAKLFGFELLSNFRFPYFSRDLAEFWRRWHISLSSWFRDYLYIPLGGSKNGKWKAVRNTFVIFLVSGFWHGASTSFLAWGFIHACGFLPLLLLNRNRIYSNDVVAAHSNLPSLKEFTSVIITFSFVTLSWIVFRCIDFDQALGFCSGIFKFNGGLQYQFQFEDLFYLLILILVDWIFRFDEISVLTFENKVFRNLTYLFIALLVISKFDILEKNTFIYFQF